MAVLRGWVVSWACPRGKICSGLPGYGPSGGGWGCGRGRSHSHATLRRARALRAAAARRRYPAPDTGPHGKRRGGSAGPRVGEQLVLRRAAGGGVAEVSGGGQ